MSSRRPIRPNSDRGRRRPFLLRHLRRRRSDEEGYVLMMAALVLVPMLVMAGFAIDLGGDYAQASRMQRAADAGALAGVVWLPDFTKAQSVATAVASQNGYTTGSGTTVTVSQTAARQLQVTIVAPEKRYFTSAILNRNQNITRTSLAEYLRPIAMGSPIASLANDPESAAAPPQLWLNQSGAGSNKSNGDRFTSGLCVSSGSGYASGCESPTAPSATNDNLDLSDSGYSYITRVSSIGSGPLRIQAFDPAFVYTGDTCTVNGWTGAQETTLKAQYSTDPKATSRYTWSNQNYCPGDQKINNLANLRTTYIVRAPDLTPNNLSDNPAICAISFDPYDGSTFGNNIFNKLDTSKPANLLPEGTQNMRFSSFFRQWVDLCTISSPVIGDYVVQITTTADQSAPHTSTTGTLSPATGGAGSLENRDPSIVTGGHNRLALRAGWGSSVSGTGLGVFGGGRLPIYVNQNTSSATFYLAQLGPSYAGATLALSFFDIADTAGSASMQVIPPPDSNYSTFPTCTFTRDGNPSNTITQSGCGITGLTSSTYDARVIGLKLQLPGDYTCNSASSSGCWLQVRLTFSGAPADTTTWSASLLGDPVRLVQ